MFHPWQARFRAALLTISIAAGASDPAGANDLPVVFHGPGSPAAEFGAPYAIRVLPGGSVVRLSGSFSWAVPQNFVAVLAQAPEVRTVELESPGGYVQPAIAVADIIRARGLDTYVGQFCASACTLAFLGGHRRFLAPAARIGFHQAHAPNVATERIDPMMRKAYSASGVPSAFIDHILSTPPQALWFPNQNELLDAAIVTGAAPADLLTPNDAPPTAWAETIKQIRWASDDTLVQFATASSDLLAQLQTTAPALCWDYTHHVQTDLGGYVRRETLDALADALRHVRDDVEHAPVPGLGAAAKAHLLATVMDTLPADTRGRTVAAMRPEGDHAAFCPALRSVLNAALALPADRRGSALRALLSGR